MMLALALGAKLTANPTDLPRRLDQIEATGTPAVRFGIDWLHCQPTLGGDYVWNHPDTLFNALRARNIKVCLLLGGRGDGHALDPDHIVGYTNFVREAVQRYHDPALYIGYENQNEVMLDHKYDTNPTPGRYVVLQRAFYETIKAITTDIPVGTSAVIGNQHWIADCYATGGYQGYFDWQAYHPYTHNVPGSPTDSMRAHRGGWYAMHLARIDMVENGDGKKPIWATEYGSPSGGRMPDARTELQQASDLADAARRFNQNPHLEHVFWFDAWDSAPQTKTPGDWMGLYRFDGTTKPAFAEFKQLQAA